MRFILFVEGQTEQETMPAFLKRWLDPRLSKPVGIKPVQFNGWAELVRDLQIKSALYLPRTDVIAVIALLDLYGPTFYPSDKITAAERYDWAKAELERRVAKSNCFFQFFAVHEVEAWLLSDPSIFPPPIRQMMASQIQNPESVNNARPPSKLLDELYTRQTRRKYRKVVNGKDLFNRLDPNKAYVKCFYLKVLLDKMLELARNAGH